ncbi:hypothetical protein, partial [Vibrio cholerae]
MPVAKFKVGDVVKVTDRDRLFDTYSAIGSRYPAWINGAIPRRLTKYDVIGVHENASTGIGTANIYAIQNASGQVYLFGESGLELAASKEEYT